MPEWDAGGLAPVIRGTSVWSFAPSLYGQHSPRLCTTSIRPVFVRRAIGTMCQARCGTLASSSVIHRDVEILNEFPNAFLLTCLCAWKCVVACSPQTTFVVKQSFFQWPQLATPKNRNLFSSYPPGYRERRFSLHFSRFQTVSPSPLSDGKKKRSRLTRRLYEWEVA